jgi:hypothetical protein
MSAPLVLALIAGAILAAQLVRAYRTEPRQLERWVRAHGLELTPESRPVVARYLRRARVLRTWGAVAGVVVPSLASLIFSGRVQVLGFGTDGDAAPLAFGWIFVGYLAGALCAELTVGRPLGGARRAASLVPRELTGYISPRLLAGQRAAAAGAAVGLVTMAAVP